jgi:serine/threonine protein phosphatase PrpC
MKRSMGFEIDIGFHSTAGTKSVNEDFCAAMLPEAHNRAMGAVAVMADGVSTGGLGRDAAQTTGMSLLRDYPCTPPTWHCSVALERIIQAQNSWWAAQNRARHPLAGMTTLTALVLRGHSYTLAHVGDTRAYLVRDGELTQLSTDHTMPGPDMHHALSRAVGADDRVLIDHSQGDLRVGDVLVLLSDGVHGVLKKTALTHLLNRAQQSETNAQHQAAALVQAALAAKTADNASALVVRVLGLDAAPLADQLKASAELPPLPPLAVGQVVDGLQVLEQLSDNGASRVYRVRHRESGQEQVLKTLHTAAAQDAHERAALVHEAWLSQALANTRAAEHLMPPVHEGPQATPTGLYARWVHVRGDTVADQIQAAIQSRRPGLTSEELPEFLKQARQLASGLGRLHQQGVVHRDIKPANLHIGRDGVARILDLGVALSGHEAPQAAQSHAGTPSYMNPEQWGFSLQGGNDAPQSANAASDVYALGVSLYEWLTGRLPFGDVLPYQVGRFHKDAPAASRHNPQVPIWLDHVLAKAISRAAEERFETAEELLLALERGASRPLNQIGARPKALMERDPVLLWKLAFAVSVLFNAMLVLWLMFLPTGR